MSSAAGRREAAAVDAHALALGEDVKRALGGHHTARTDATCVLRGGNLKMSVVARGGWVIRS